MIYLSPYQVLGAAGSAGCKQAFVILNALAPKLTDATMQRLNYEVSGKQREPSGQRISDSRRVVEENLAQWRRNL